MPKSTRLPSGLPGMFFFFQGEKLCLAPLLFSGFNSPSILPKIWNPKLWRLQFMLPCLLQRCPGVSNIARYCLECFNSPKIIRFSAVNCNIFCSGQQESSISWSAQCSKFLPRVVTFTIVQKSIVVFVPSGTLQ